MKSKLQSFFLFFFFKKKKNDGTSSIYALSFITQITTRDGGDDCSVITVSRFISLRQKQQNPGNISVRRNVESKFRDACSFPSVIFVRSYARAFRGLTKDKPSHWNVQGREASKRTAMRVSSVSLPLRKCDSSLRSAAN